MSKKERNDLRKKELDDLESLLAEFGTTSSAENQSENQVKEPVNTEETNNDVDDAKKKKKKKKKASSNENPSTIDVVENETETSAKSIEEIMKSRAAKKSKKVADVIVSKKVIKPKK
jgi:hypothetical protein